ncbi:MAG: fatty acid desaturase [Halieaceae bacterium]|jgi:fatty acid desaturase
MMDIINGSGPAHVKIKDYLSADEVGEFTSKSDYLAARTVVISWLSIALVFVVVNTWTNPLTIFLALLALAGRQLGLAVIEHECGHHTLFETESLNRFCGQWLAAKAVFSDMHTYARDHTGHHRHAGTTEDPDLSNYVNYPVNKASFKRKVIRDLTGQTGFKLIRFIASQAAGIFAKDKEKRQRARSHIEQIAVNIVLASLLGVFLSPWLYLLWIGAFVTTYTLIVRIRQVAEHAAVPDQFSEDPRNNTRTTIPYWWERLVFAPNYVNYHLEHHFMAGVPCYRLPALHRLLRERGAYTETRIFHGYNEVVRHAITGQ